MTPNVLTHFPLCRGWPEEMGNYVGRIIIPVSESKVCFSYHSSETDPQSRQGGRRPGRLYVGNPATGERSAKPQQATRQQT